MHMCSCPDIVSELADVLYFTSCNSMFPSTKIVCCVPPSNMLTSFLKLHVAVFSNRMCCHADAIISGEHKLLVVASHLRDIVRGQILTLAFCIGPLGVCRIHTSIHTGCPPVQAHIGRQIQRCHPAKKHWRRVALLLQRL